MERRSPTAPQIADNRRLAAALTAEPRGATRRNRPNGRLMEENEAFVRWQHDRDPAARDQLVQRHLPLVHKLARRYKRGCEPLDDLVQVASLGLIKAIDRFDSERDSHDPTATTPTAT